MTTTASVRFTASEALLFFEEHLNESRPADLAKPYRDIRTNLEQYDLWRALSTEETARWAAYRGPIKVDTPSALASQ